VRSEMMDPDTLETVLAALSEQGIGTVDITGGAPELNPNFRRLVIGSRKMGRRVIMRTNLTVFFEEGMDYLPRFYDEHSVEIIASLPYYKETKVDRVGGGGAFGRDNEKVL
jgi:MoaA/NifB/PqqE/SkfB family radical SAM enzyme